MWIRACIALLTMCAFAGTALAAQQTRGVVRGFVTVSGEHAASFVPVSQHQDVCGDRVPNRHLLVEAGRVANALVMLEYKGRAQFGKTTVTLENTDCDFEPTVQVAPPGATLLFRNTDPIRHTMLLEQNGVSLGAVAVEPGARLRQNELLAQTGPLDVRCEAHNWMHATVWILDHPYYAMTASDGSFHIGLVPSGTYRLRVWHEVLGVIEQDVTIRGNETVAANFAYHP